MTDNQDENRQEGVLVPEPAYRPEPVQAPEPEPALELEPEEEAEPAEARGGRTEMIALILLLLIIFGGVMYADVIDPSEAWKSEWTYSENTDPFTDVVTAHAVLPSSDGGLEEAGIYVGCTSGRPLVAAIHNHNPNSVALTQPAGENMVLIRFDRHRPFRLKLPPTGDFGPRSEEFLGLLARARKMVVRHEGAFGHAEFPLAGTKAVLGRLRRACLPPGARPAERSGIMAEVDSVLASIKKAF